MSTIKKLKERFPKGSIINVYLYGPWHGEKRKRKTLSVVKEDKMGEYTEEGTPIVLIDDEGEKYWVGFWDRKWNYLDGYYSS